MGTTDKHNRNKTPQKRKQEEQSEVSEVEGRRRKRSYRHTSNKTNI